MSAEPTSQLKMITSNEEDAPNHVFEREAILKNHRAGHSENTGQALSEREKPHLQLDGRGRLRTLKDTTKNIRKSNHGQINSGEEQFPLKRGRARKSLLVIMKYGRSDLHYRQKFGLRLREILKSSQKAETEDTQPLKTEGTNPFKPTHPFFSDQVTHESKVENSTEQAKAQATRAMSNTNCKTFSTPGKLKNFATNAENSRPSLFGLHADVARDRTRHVTGHKGFILPWRGFARIEPSVDSPFQIHTCKSMYALSQRRLKTRTIESEVECSILTSMTEETMRNASVASSDVGTLGSADVQDINVPNQLMQSSEELQGRIKPQISHGETTRPLPQAISRLYQRLQYQRTPFDLGTCESNSWNQKYAPEFSAEVLQSTREMTSLREWLKSLTVSNVGSGVDSTKPARPGNASKNLSIDVNNTVPSAKKRRKLKDIDDFVVSSDDENDELRAVSDTEGPFVHSLPGKRSVIRAEGTQTKSKKTIARTSNVVLLSGPHGCGKTAAAHAVARELDFEIFEINSATRRSGKDVIDKVGDMALNHQVRRRSGSSSNLMTGDNEVWAAQQTGTLNSFFAPSKTNQNIPAPPQAKLEGQNAAKPPARRQKQSLILLEEVDVLFEDDKQFWETILDLALQSKRPIIMTCSDESLLPIHDISLHAIFRLQSPPLDVATKYMLVMAALEGHLLDYGAVRQLYESRGHDLRASISDLNFWCQMAVGDEKGGMGWFLKAQNTNQSDGGRRVMSNKTYQAGLDWLPRTSNDRDNLQSQECLALAAWSQWRVDPSVLSMPRSEPDSLSVHVDHTASSSAPLPILVRYSEHSDNASVADILYQLDCPGQDTTEVDSLGTTHRGETVKVKEKLDPSLPELSHSQKADYFQGYPVLQADSMRDFERLGARIKVAIHLCLRRLWTGEMSNTKEQNDSTKLLQSLYIGRIKQEHANEANRKHYGQDALIQAISPIFDEVETSGSVDPTACYPTWNHSRIDVTQDIGPYIRSIVDCDLLREHQRQALEEASEGRKHSQKRARTTRASRTALQGAQRNTARPERWLPKGLDYEIVSKTRFAECCRLSLKLEESGTTGEEPELDPWGSVSPLGQSSVESNG